jgi:hypothetical protein
MLTAATVLAASTAKLVGHRLRHIMIALVERRLRLRRIAPRVGLLLAAMVVVGVLLELTPEDGFRVFRAWTASGLPTDARSASPTTPRFAPSATTPASVSGPPLGSSRTMGSVRADQQPPDP